MNTSQFPLTSRKSHRESQWHEVNLYDEQSKGIPTEKEKEGYRLWRRTCARTLVRTREIRRESLRTLWKETVVLVNLFWRLPPIGSRLQRVTRLFFLRDFFSLASLGLCKVLYSLCRKSWWEESVSTDSLCRILTASGERMARESWCKKNDEISSSWSRSGFMTRFLESRDTDWAMLISSGNKSSDIHRMNEWFHCQLRESE